jgi:hypothetical protein
MLVQRLPEAGDVAVPEDPEAAAEEAVLDAVTLDELRGQEVEQRLAGRSPDRRGAAASAAAPRCFLARASQPENTSLNASMYACALPEGPFSVMPSGRSGWL